MLAVLTGRFRYYELCSPLSPGIAELHRDRPNVAMCADKSQKYELETLTGAGAIAGLGVRFAEEKDAVA